MALSGATAADADVAPIRTIGSMQLLRFDHPDEIRTVEKARIELVELGELAVETRHLRARLAVVRACQAVGTESC